MYEKTSFCIHNKKLCFVLKNKILGQRPKLTKKKFLVAL